MEFIGIVVVESILVHVQVYVLTVQLVRSKDSSIISIICDPELALGIIQCQNVGD